jgi:hypothetical protein
MPAAENIQEENSPDQHLTGNANEHHPLGESVEKTSNLNEEEVNENILQPQIIEQSQATDAPLQTEEMEVHHHPDLHHSKKIEKMHYRHKVKHMLIHIPAPCQENVS